MEKDKISIIVPVYNVEKYLGECLDALINQTYTNIEILCINDGSKDSSGAILDEYTKKDNRIKVFHQKNSGPAKARNVGLENATGEYLMFCDSDDTYEPNMCEAMHDAMTKNDVDFAICDCNIIEHDENHGRTKASMSYHNLQFFGLLDLTSYMKLSINCLLWNKIFKIALIKQYDVRFPDGYESDDESFVIQYVGASRRAIGLENKLYNYKLLQNSVMGKVLSAGKVQKLFDIIFAFEFAIKNLKKNSLLVNNHNNIIARLYGITIYFVFKYLSYSDAKKFLKLLSEHLLLYFTFEELENYDLLLQSKMGNYDLALKRYYSARKKNISPKKKIMFGKVKVDDKNNKFYFFGYPILKSKILAGMIKYYLFGFNIYTKLRYNAFQELLDNFKATQNKIQSLNDKISNFQLQNILSLEQKISSAEKLIICFDNLNDVNQECIDAYIVFKQLQKNNIPSKYIVLKDNSLYQKIKNDNSIISTLGAYDFVHNNIDIITKTKKIFTSFGLDMNLNRIFATLPYLEYIYIDHGVTLFKKWEVKTLTPKQYNKVLIPTKLSYESYKNTWNDGDMICLNLPRWKELDKNIKENKIFVFFTYRLTFSNNPGAIYKYTKAIVNFIKKLSKEVGDTCQITFAWHSKLKMPNITLPNIVLPNVKMICNTNISEEIKTAGMLITDYSSIAFDFMYQNKPVIFYRFDKDEVYLNEQDQFACIEAMRYDNKLYNAIYDEKEILDKVKFYINNNYILESEYIEKNKETMWGRDKGFLR